MSAPAIMIGLDPSSTACGYAVTNTDGPPNDLIDCGVLTPTRGWVLGARCDWIGRRVRKLLTKYEPVAVVIETPARSVRGERRLRQGQAAYGVAVGWVWREVSGHKLRPVIAPYAADDWTRRGPPASRTKKARAERVRSLYHQYDFSEDTGFDACDAVALVTFYRTERRLRQGIG